MCCVFSVYLLCVWYVFIVSLLCICCVFAAYPMCIHCIFIVYSMCIHRVLVACLLCICCVFTVYLLCIKAMQILTHPVVILLPPALPPASCTHPVGVCSGVSFSRVRDLLRLVRAIIGFPDLIQTGWLGWFILFILSACARQDAHPVLVFRFPAVSAGCRLGSGGFRFEPPDGFWCRIFCFQIKLIS